MAAYIDENMTQKDLYHQSIMEKVKALFDLGSSELVDRETDGYHGLYRLGFVDLIKKDGNKWPCLCVAAYNSDAHGLFTAAPTVRRTLFHIFIAVRAPERLNLYIRDVKSLCHE